MGALVADRINPEMAPQGEARPHIVVRLTSGSHDYGLTGPNGLRRSRVTVLCAADTITSADRVAEAVIAALRWIDTTRDGVKVNTWHDTPDASSYDDEAKAFVRYVGFMVVTGGA